jgi:hypothetical protein
LEPVIFGVVVAEVLRIQLVPAETVALEVAVVVHLEQLQVV